MIRGIFISVKVGLNLFQKIMFLDVLKFKPFYIMSNDLNSITFPWPTFHPLENVSLLACLQVSVNYCSVFHWNFQLTKIDWNFLKTRLLEYL